MCNKRFSGIMPAMVTPFDENGALMAGSARRMMQRALDAGVTGFYVNGATGEGLFISEKTRMEMAETAVETCRGKGRIINHVGAVDALSAIRLAKHAGQIDCDAISSLVPNYINTYSDEQVLDYYKRLSDASGLPVLVYCTGLVNGDPYEFMKKAIQVDGIIGLKYTMFNYYNMHRICGLNGGDINVINGPDEMLICGLTMGADGGIGSTYNLMPDWFVELYNAYRVGDFAHAQETQFRINRVIEVILKYGCIPAIKEVYTAMGYEAGNVAYPGKRYSDDEKALLIRDMKAAGFKME